MKNLSVFIGIPAHNEEKNIKQLLQSINSQEVEGFEVGKIVVVCDACTDSTELVVKELQPNIKNLEVINDGKRLGTAKRLQELYLLSENYDLFITFDADIAFGDSKVLKGIVDEFRVEDVVLVGANAFAVGGNNYFSRCALAYESFWKNLSLSINGGNNIHTHLGCASAIRVHFLKSLSFPTELTAWDHYLFLKAVEQSKEYKLAKESVVYFKVATNLKDYVAQHSRYLLSENAVEKSFSEKVLEVYKISKAQKIKSYAQTLIKEHIFLIGAVGVQIYLRTQLRKNAKYSHAIWETLKSTKELTL